MYSPLNAASFFTSKNAGEECTSSSRHSSAMLLDTARSRGHRAAPSRAASGSSASPRADSPRRGSARARPCRGASRASGASRSRGAGRARRPAARRRRGPATADRLRRVGQVLLGPDDVRDAHVDVVDDVGEDEHRRCRCERCSTKSSMCAFSNTGSPRMRSTTLVDPSRGVRNRRARPSPGTKPAITAEPVVARTLVALRPRVDHLARAVAVVGVARREQASGGVRVQRGALALEVGTLVPLDADPPQRVWMPSIHSSRLRSVSVSSMRRTNVPPCWRGVDPVVEGGLRAAHVEVARRGRREPHARRSRRGHRVRLLAAAA